MSNPVLKPHIDPDADGTFDSHYYPHATVDAALAALTPVNAGAVVIGTGAGAAIADPGTTDGLFETRGDGTRYHPSHVGIVVAASNTPAPLLRLAKYRCDGTADDVEWQAAITEAQVSTSQAMDVILLPGTYNLSANITWGAANLIGTGGLIASGVRVFWSGSAGATVFTKTTCGAGRMYNISFRGAASGGVVPGTWIDYTVEGVDKFCRLDNVQFAGSSGPLVKIGDWINLHWRDVRFDNWGTYALACYPQTTMFQTNFVIDGLTADNGGGSATSQGFFYIEDPGVTNGGTWTVRGGRLEVNTAMLAPQAIIHHKYTGTVNTRNIGFHLEDITYQDVVGMASDVLLYRDTADATMVDSLTLTTVRQSGLSNILGGTWNTSLAAQPPLQTAYPKLISGAIASAGTILDSLWITGSAASGARNLRVRNGGADTDDRLYISNAGDLYFGTGSATPDVRAYRSGTATLRVNPNFAVTGTSTLSGDVTVTGHVISNGTTPTIAAGTSAGTSPTVSLSANSTDLAGRILVTTGTSPAASNNVVIVTFSAAFGATPRSALINPSNAAAAALSGTGLVYADGASTTTAHFVLKVGSTALAASTAYEWTYQVTG